MCFLITTLKGSSDQTPPRAGAPDPHLVQLGIVCPTAIQPKLWLLMDLLFNQADASALHCCDVGVVAVEMLWEHSQEVAQVVPGRAQSLEPVPQSTGVLQLRSPCAHPTGQPWGRLLPEGASRDHT